MCYFILNVVSVQLLSYVWLCDPMDCFMPGFLVLHYLPEFAQNCVHWVSDTIQPSHPAAPFSCPQSFPTSGFFSLSWLFASGGQSIGPSAIASVLQWMFTVDFLYHWLVWSPCCPRDSQESSSAPQFESINSSVLSFLYGVTLTSAHDPWRNYSYDYITLLAKWCICF